MDNIAGSPVEGANFYGREADRDQLVETLENDDVLLLGPRRIGKTSIARAVMAEVRRKGWNTVEVPVASCVSEAQFISRLNAALRPGMAGLGKKLGSAIRDGFKAVAGRVKGVKVGVPGTGGVGIELGTGEVADWTVAGAELVALMAGSEGRWLVYIDELPIMLFNIIEKDAANGVQRVRRILDWFRNDVRAADGTQHIHWLITGSVGLDTLVQQHGMADTINSLAHRSLPPFDAKVAAEMLMELAGRYQLPLLPADAGAMVAAIQWPQPYYLQMAFQHLRMLCAAKPHTAPGELIEEAIDCMWQPDSDNDFHHWESRLDLQLGPQLGGQALALLKLSARDPLGASPALLMLTLGQRMPNSSDEELEQRFIQLRTVLLRDAYWWQDESSGQRRYRVRLEPLRRWWAARSTV
ncbi:ATP-binding protein [Massilia endophytica]|uniref:ATP-binding protein n=1 Tax=Massilia endophytica TaxID=2899220 RepID=UPI001E50BEFC|nr:ATP-binding protein [Massilia endophytica]UGQ47101.1 ATP-binding protein [Massilia endophytica]